MIFVGVDYVEMLMSYFSVFAELLLNPRQDANINNLSKTRTILLGLNLKSDIRKKSNYSI